MPKDDTSSGLLSKVVKFVRNPATNWSDLDNKESNRDEAMSKQLLKEMIERKRRNDFVRKREFDMLRKMRKREAMVGQDAAGRPSFFQSSMPSKPDDRANTLKKIDEIEAQMSMQWWKTKQGTSAMDSVNSSAYQISKLPEGGGNPNPHRVPLVAYGATEPAGLQLAAGSADLKAAEPSPRRPMVSTTQARPAKARAVAGAGTPGDGNESGSSGFTASRMVAIDVAEIAHDAELEEASIGFANGDDASAEAGLLQMLARDGSRADNSETWMALFDFYRATAQQDKFETAALQFVQRFDRSAPPWFSIPEMVKQLGAAAGIAAGSSRVADWSCPSVVGIQTVAALKVALAKKPMPWHLDWSKLKTIDANAAEPLFKVFGSWSAQPVQLRFIGDAQLQNVLQDLTPSGQRESLQVWWHLRMEALRVTHRPDEFELAALDFCVTYEVSPPSWETARCEYKVLDSEGIGITGHTIIGDVYRDSELSGLSVLQDGDTQLDASNSQMGQLFSVELSGQIQGDAIAVLEQLEAKLMGADIMIISCSKLIRVDFSAAGTLLNWVSARQAENRAVQFTEVNRLVAAFFNVIGITEYAVVSIRRD